MKILILILMLFIQSCSIYKIEQNTIASTCWNKYQQGNLLNSRCNKAISYGQGE